MSNHIIITDFSWIKLRLSITSVRSEEAMRLQTRFLQKQGFPSLISPAFARWLFHFGKMPHDFIFVEPHVLAARIVSALPAFQIVG